MSHLDRFLQRILTELGNLPAPSNSYLTVPTSLHRDSHVSPLDTVNPVRLQRHLSGRTRACLAGHDRKNRVASSAVIEVVLNYL